MINLVRPRTSDIVWSNWEQCDGDVQTFLEATLNKNLNVETLSRYVPFAHRHVTFFEMIKKMKLKGAVPFAYQKAIVGFVANIPVRFEESINSINLNFEKLVERNEEVFSFLKELEVYADGLERENSLLEGQVSSMQKKLSDLTVSYERRLLDVEKDVLASVASKMRAGHAPELPNESKVVSSPPVHQRVVRPPVDVVKNDFIVQKKDLENEPDTVVNPALFSGGNKK